MSPEELYFRLGALIENVPNLSAQRIDASAARWLGEAYALVAETGQAADAQLIVFNTKTLLREGNEEVARYVMSIIYRALAVAELKAPAPVRGAFIGVGNAFDGMAAIGKIFAGATKSLRVVDPYLDDTALSKFAVLADPKIVIELLADSASVRPSLAPAVAAWKQQYPNERTIEARLSNPKALHDRLIVVDGNVAYSVSQSLKDLAARSPASISRIDGEPGDLKIAAYEDFWRAAKPIP